MRHLSAAILLLAASTAVTALHAEDTALHFLSASEAAAEHLVPPPPPRGSQAEALELARLKALIAGTSAERRAQAEADGPFRDPTVFSAAMGRDLAKLPATMALLGEVQRETEIVIDAAKLKFNQPRPFVIDPSIPHCGKGENPLKGYPSGHAGFAWSVGWALAQLDPDHATAVLTRAADYGLSREICGVHFHVDTEASRAIGMFVADRMLADPRLAKRLAAVRAELRGN